MKDKLSSGHRQEMKEREFIIILLWMDLRPFTLSVILGFIPREF
jgi:hypothetical protein